VDADTLSNRPGLGDRRGFGNRVGLDVTDTYFLLEAIVERIDLLLPLAANSWILASGKQKAGDLSPASKNVKGTAHQGIPRTQRTA